MDICSKFDHLYFYVKLNHVFEGLFFTKNITINTDELEEEKREKMPQKMKSNSTGGADKM